MKGAGGIDDAEEWINSQALDISLRHLPTNMIIFHVQGEEKPSRMSKYNI